LEMLVPRLLLARRVVASSKPALLARVARNLPPLTVLAPFPAVRWCSQTADATVASPRVADLSANQAPAPLTSHRNRMMKALKERDYDKVLSLYEEMVENSVTPDLLALNCIVEAKARSEGTVAAQESLQVMLSQHPSLQPNSNTYVALVRPCEQDGNMKLAFSLYEELLSLGQQPDLSMYNSLISTCTAANDFAAAEGIFTEMRDKGVKPKSMSYLKYIWACFRNRQPDLAYKMLLNMENEWRVPTREDYARMLKLFKWHNHADGKLHCVQGIVQDVNMHSGSASASLNALEPEIISGLFREAQEKKRPDEVVRLAETLTQGGVKLDRFQQVGLIFAHLKLNQAVQAFEVLVDLYANGQTLPPRAADGIAADLAKHEASVDESYYLLESRKAAGKDVPLAAVNMVIEACAVMGDLDRAFATWAELEQFALEPDTGTYNALLRTCVETRELASGRRLLSRMAQDGVTPDSVTFMHQTAIYIMSRDSRQALETLQRCKDAGLVPPSRMYVGLINLLARNRMTQEAQELMQEMETHHTVTKFFKDKVAEALSK